MKRLIWVIAAVTIGVGSIFGGRNDGKDSIAYIIQEMKNGDQSRTKDLAEAYRYGQGVEKSMLNAMICYQIAGVDFESEAKRTFKENPNDEFARLVTLLNMYDRHYIEEAKVLLSDTPGPAPTWATMMKKVIDYKGDDINGFILSLIGPDSTPDECFLAFGCFISNNKESNDLKPLMDISSVLTDKAPFLNNVLAQAKLEEYKTNPEGNKELLSEALTYFKKANDAGFLTPRFARIIFEDDIMNDIDIATIFTPEDLEQLKRLAASATSESNHAAVIEMTPPEEAVELIDSVTIEEAFNLIATLDGFEKVDEVSDSFNFPKEIGKPTMIAHANATHREEILWFMDRLTESTMVYDDTDEKGRFDRLFLETGTNDLLYVHVGLNGNDTVLILFQGGNRPDIDKFIEELNAQ